MLLVHGVVGGVWHAKRAQKRVEITVEPIAALTARQRRELENEAADVGAIIGMEAELIIGTVTTRSHL